MFCLLIYKLLFLAAILNPEIHCWRRIRRIRNLKKDSPMEQPESENLKIRIRESGSGFTQWNRPLLHLPKIVKQKTFYYLYVHCLDTYNTIFVRFS